MPVAAKATTCAKVGAQPHDGDKDAGRARPRHLQMAVLAAARQDARPTWVAAPTPGCSVLDGTADRLLCLFGFPVYGEFACVPR